MPAAITDFKAPKGLDKISPTLNFNNQTVVVTGAAAGIGADEVRAFHRLGANVIGIDVQGDKLASLTEELGNDRFTPITFDLSETDSDAYAELGAQIIEASSTGQIDAYVMNAGVVKLSADGAYSDKMAQINAWSHRDIFNAISGALADDARIVVTSSPIVGRTNDATIGYARTKEMLEKDVAKKLVGVFEYTDIKVVGYVPPPVQNFLRTDLKPKEPMHAHPHGIDMVGLPVALASRDVDENLHGEIIAMGYDHLREKGQHDDGTGYDFMPRAEDGGFMYDLRIRHIGEGGGDDGSPFVEAFSTQPWRNFIGEGATPKMDPSVKLEDVYQIPAHVAAARKLKL